MTSRTPPSRRDPEYAEKQIARAVRAKAPGIGRVPQAAPNLSGEVEAMIRGRSKDGIGNSHAMAYSTSSDWDPSLELGWSIVSSAGADITLSASTIWTINTTGRYVLSFATSHTVSASTVKGRVGTRMNTSGLAVTNLLYIGDSMQSVIAVDGALSYLMPGNNLEVVATSPPVPFTAGENFRVEGEFAPGSGNVGNVDASCLFTIVRVP